MKIQTKIQNLEKEMNKYVKKHDKIENPICYTGNCPICRKMDEIQDKIKDLKEKKKND